MPSIQVSYFSPGYDKSDGKKGRSLKAMELTKDI